MKRMRCESVEDANKALNEMNAVIRLSHKNMVHYEELFFDQVITMGLDNEGNPVEDGEDFVCIVMPYYMNNDLEHFIKEYKKINKKNIPESMVLDITRQIVDFVAYFHENGMIHRDLKPKNILMANLTPPIENLTEKAAGNVLKESFNRPFDYKNPKLKFELKIGDFGLSTYFSKESLRSTTCGTPYYMAPEIHSNSYSTPVDVFSIGCILSFILTGEEYPWYSLFTPNKKARAFRVMKKKIADRGYDQRWYHLLANILSEEPSNRFTANELKEALAHFEHIPVTPSPISKRKPTPPSLKKRLVKSDGSPFSKKKKSTVPFSGDGRQLSTGKVLSSSKTPSKKISKNSAFSHHLHKNLSATQQLDLNSKLTAAQALVGQTEALMHENAPEKPNSFVYSKTSKPTRTSYMSRNTGRIVRDTEKEMNINISDQLRRVPPPIVQKSKKIADSNLKKKKKKKKK
eukprot:CAMPEP_0117422632 /NCGR_PEP_ID=MMETSP0758-20121206/3442_1 /TAXON_ID=63605 /ORGANISM="Percolomonas cosmopolitus, Strain AE-1 (ATCC 50343)" /LENGTH=459 /DNA_ID=CAMNT_0005205387 /DNA_START=26 /DNA_END=1405 /DNA_ORIENTATION=+